ncbi:hypothetical protein MTR67_020054 [Solanum verrucosum]|uniref:Uncharacterized protein n=1 Tax=Solanum verrucosum TaxID=315347 RepID=A0AAF0QMK3_SOLVR|nr:hypothetical protein MTR67_020054 [Solanum verrucosum]
MVIMVEGVHKVGEEEISEVVEVGVMVMQAEVQCNMVGKSSVKMIGLSVTPFRARPRQRRSTYSYVSVRFASKFAMICDILDVSIHVSTPVGEEKLEWEGVYKSKQAKIISSIRARKLVGQDCLAYLAYLAHNRDVEIESPSIESILVVSEFREVFPTDLPSMPPYRDINFCIDLEPGTHPISISPYCMAPAELRELKAQIQELLDK